MPLIVQIVAEYIYYAFTDFVFAGGGFIERIRYTAGSVKIYVQTGVAKRIRVVLNHFGGFGAVFVEYPE